MLMCMSYRKDLGDNTKNPGSATNISHFVEICSPIIKQF
jgi:hypothetical protein